MKQKPKQNCGTCKHADFKRTPTGRIKKDVVSQCGYDLDLIELPEIPSAAMVVLLHYTAVRADDGADCAYWEPRPAALKG